MLVIQNNYVIKTIFIIIYSDRLELGRPASLHPLRIPTGSLWEEHCVVADFEKDSDQQLSVKAGSKVIVVNKDESGTMNYQTNNYRVGLHPYVCLYTIACMYR